MEISQEGSATMLRYIEEKKDQVLFIGADYIIAWSKIYKPFLFNKQKWTNGEYPNALCRWVHENQFEYSQEYVANEKIRAAWDKGTVGFYGVFPDTGEEIPLGFGTELLQKACPYIRDLKVLKMKPLGHYITDYRLFPEPFMNWGLTVCLKISWK